MEWTKELMLKRAPEMAKQAKVRDFEGKTDDDFVAFMATVNEKGFKVPGLDTEDEIRKAWKTVEISFDSSTDDVNVTDMATASADGEGEDADLKVTDTDSEETKQYKKLRNELREAGFGKPQMLKSLHEWGTSSTAKAPRSAASHDRVAERKRYDRKAARGETAFSCSDSAEIANAWHRINWLSGTKHHDYEWRSYDLDVITKAGSTYDNTLGGFLVPDSVAAEMIDLKAQYGIARQITGFESMPTPKHVVNRHGDDVVVYKTAEGTGMTESDMTFEQVTLISEELGALSLMSNRLVNLSPISIADRFGVSAARGFGKFEDDSFFNSANGFKGLKTSVGTNSTFTVASATKWSSVTLDQLLEWKSMLPAYADNFSVEEIPITCTRPVFEQVFRKYALAQGGSTTDDLLAAGELRFDGHPIILNNSMDRTFANNAIGAYIGPFKYVTKMGELEGSARVDASDQRHFEKNQLTFRAIEEVAINCHDVNNKVDSDGNNLSGVVALKFTT